MLKKIINFSIIVSVIAAASYISVISYRENKRNNGIEKEISELKNEADKVRKTNRELKDKIAYFQTEDFQEKEAKNSLNMQKADEQVVIVMPGNSENSEKKDEKNEKTNIPSEKISIEKPSYIQWYDYFFENN